MYNNLIDFDTTMFEALSEKTFMKGTKQHNMERNSTTWNETAQHGTKQLSIGTKQLSIGTKQLNMEQNSPA
jgi:hypothetical protein